MGIFHQILLVPQNTNVDLNNVMIEHTMWIINVYHELHTATKVSLGWLTNSKVALFWIGWLYVLSAIEFSICAKKKKIKENTKTNKQTVKKTVKIACTK